MLSTKRDDIIVQEPDWLNDEALDNGIFFALSHSEHHALALAKYPVLVAPGTYNMIGMKKKVVDRSAYAEDKVGVFMGDNQKCESSRSGIDYDKNNR